MKQKNKFSKQILKKHEKLTKLIFELNELGIVFYGKQDELCLYHLDNILLAGGSGQAMANRGERIPYLSVPIKDSGADDSFYFKD